MQEQHAFDGMTTVRDTRRAALLKIAPRTGTIRRRVLNEIVSRGKEGLTDDEIAERLDLSPNTARPRRVELVEGFWIADSGLRRESFYGNPAIVWAPLPKAIILVKSERPRAGKTR